MSGPVVFINPNSTEAMTWDMVAAAREAVPGVAIEGWTSLEGPPAIQGEADGRLAVPPLLELVARADAEGAGAIVLGCFDDTGLAEARAMAGCPVIGIGQASFHLAALGADRFSVVTTLPISVPVIEGNIRGMGFDRQLGRVRASGLAVLALEADPEAALGRIAAEIAAAEAEDGVGAVILGCAGMVRFRVALRERTALLVVDGVTAAAWAAAFLRLRARA